MTWHFTPWSTIDKNLNTIWTQWTVCAGMTSLRNKFFHLFLDLKYHHIPSPKILTNHCGLLPSSSRRCMILVLQSAASDCIMRPWQSLRIINLRSRSSTTRIKSIDANLSLGFLEMLFNINIPGIKFSLQGTSTIIEFWELLTGGMASSCVDTAKNVPPIDHRGRKEHIS